MTLSQDERRASPKMLYAMKLLRNGWPRITPYRAAKEAGIALSTMYRSRLYKQWKKEKGK